METGSVFISYSSGNEVHVNALARVFEEGGIPYNSFLHNPALPGASLPHAIQTNILESDFIILIWSENALNSNWVPVRVYHHTPGEYHE